MLFSCFGDRMFTRKTARRWNHLFGSLFQRVLSAWARLDSFGRRVQGAEVRLEEEEGERKRVGDQVWPSNPCPRLTIYFLPISPLFWFPPPLHKAPRGWGEVGVGEWGQDRQGTPETEGQDTLSSKHMGLWARFIYKMQQGLIFFWKVARSW